MLSLSLYNQTCAECSQLITHRYSTSFSMGIRLFDKKLRLPICAIYGFVRLADEIVDTFHGYEKAELLQKFRLDAYKAIDDKISLNPVLHAFQEVVRRYHIDNQLIDAFLDSMAMDLHFSTYEDSLYKQYIYGSAEVVGLMCLRVFTDGNESEYQRLKTGAQALGSAFQKINFLRDMKSDFAERGRVYFPNIDYQHFTSEQKNEIEEDIKKDFDIGYKSILQLPSSARFGVYLAYVYYLNLFKKIRKANVERVKEERIRVKNRIKVYLLCRSMVQNSLNLL